MNRRKFTALFIALFVKSSFAGALRSLFNKESKNMIMNKTPIDFQWPIKDPFLFCVHHFDHYPKGNKNLGLDSSHFQGRNMGSDFNLKDGFRLYHGEEIPGFPVHPHRGFETITIVRKGYVDHADSLGAAGRYGEGDVQWMTAGSGVQHSEMFPLLHQDKENTLELFQIWINLPAKDKMVPADFKMLWAHKIPEIKLDKVNVSLISGTYEGKEYYEAPKNSWASNKENEVNILLVKMQEGATFTYPRATKNKNRMIYFFVGNEAKINDETIKGKMAVELDAASDFNITVNAETEFLILDSVPINEPVFQHGPFVMNTREEVIQTFEDYQKTNFGGWKWERKDMIHGPKIEKFAKYPSGKIEKPNV